MHQTIQKRSGLFAVCGLVACILTTVCLYAKPLWANVTASQLCTAMVGKSYTMTQGYLNPDPINESPDRKHAGIDYGAPSGTTVRTVIGGKVVRVNPDYGLVGVYDQKKNATIFYLHMRNLKVAEGQIIEFGTPIGTVSNVHASSVHLHIEIRPGLQLKAVSRESLPADTTKLTLNPLTYF